MFEGVDLLLRRFDYGDIDGILACLNDVLLHRYLADSVPFPYGFERAEAFVSEARECFPFVCAIEYEGRFAGAVSLMEKADVYRANMEIGYWVGRMFWGKGIASEAIRQMANVAFREKDIYRLYADVFAGNAASIAALKKNKFVQEGYFPKSLVKYGALQDCAVYALGRDSWGENREYFRRGNDLYA